MLLTVKDRMTLLSVLPVDGVRMTDLRISHDLRMRLAFTEDEQEAFGFIQAGDRLTWDVTKDTGTEIDIGPRAHVLIVDALKKLDKEEKLTIDHVDIWEKFGCDEDD